MRPSSTIALLAVVLLPVAASGESPARQEFRAVIAAEPNEAHGRELFANCSGCHGPSATGTTEGAIPRIAGQHFQVLARELIHFRYAERWNDRMEDVAMNLHTLRDAQDIADVASFVSHLDRGGPRGIGDGAMVERGAAAYAVQCASCHGQDGEGDDRGWVPRLAGQHAGYLMRQIYDARGGRRPPMSRDHRKLLQDLDYDDMVGLTDHLARIGWDPPIRRVPPYDTPTQ
jgi:cytochrome c553